VVDVATMNVTIGMDPDMVEELDDEAERRGWSRSKTVRYLLRECDESPLPLEDEP
jgi:metal-responsive CopG/Arc/MetJ family transcriptional regulator